MGTCIMALHGWIADMLSVDTVKKEAFFSPPTDHGHWVETLCGHSFDLISPRPEQVDINDIIISLSRASRYMGHTLGDKPYTVLAHSLWVEQYLLSKTGNSLLALHGLLHDAHEAYLGDIAAPLKNIPAIKAAVIPLEEAIQNAIYQALGLPRMSDDQSAEIAIADRQALAQEAYYLKVSSGTGWPLDLRRDAVTRAIGLRLVPTDEAAHLFRARIAELFAACSIDANPIKG